MPFKNPHPLYATWINMRNRCLRPNTPNYPDYGGRGITICERWDNFHAFASDMGERPANNSIERLNNDGPYSPDNCVWATKSAQNRNQRKTRKVTIEGIQYTAADIAEIAGLKTDTVVNRAAQGLTYAEVTDPAPRAYEIKRHSGDPKGVKTRTVNSRSRTACRNGHPWPQWQSFNKAGNVVCIMCGRERALRWKAKKQGVE